MEDFGTGVRLKLKREEKTSLVLWRGTIRSRSRCSRPPSSRMLCRLRKSGMRWNHPTDRLLMTQNQHAKNVVRHSSSYFAARSRLLTYASLLEQIRHSTEMPKHGYTPERVVSSGKQPPGDWDHHHTNVNQHNWSAKMTQSCLYLPVSNATWEGRSYRKNPNPWDCLIIVFYIAEITLMKGAWHQDCQPYLRVENDLLISQPPTASAVMHVNQQQEDHHKMNGGTNHNACIAAFSGRTTNTRTKNAMMTPALTIAISLECSIK